MSDAAIAVDWNSKPEPWRTIGLRFRAEMRGEPFTPFIRPSIIPTPPPVTARSRRLATVRDDDTTPRARLIRLRGAQNWSQSDLAKASGLGIAAVFKAEQADSKVIPAIQAHIAAAFGVLIEDIWP